MAAKREDDKIIWLMPLDKANLSEVVERELKGSTLITEKRVFLKLGHMKAGLKQISAEHLPEFKSMDPQIKNDQDVAKFIEVKMKEGKLLYSKVAFLYGKRKLLAVYGVNANQVLAVVIGSNGFIITAFPFARVDGKEAEKYDSILTSVVKPPKKVSKPAKPVIRVHIWDYRGLRESLGHASLSLSDMTNISWWPILKNDSGKTGLWTAVRSVDHVDDQPYLEDVWGEERKPDFVIEFHPGELDEAKIKTWWEQFRKTEKYNLRSNNCSTVVFKALKEGGADKYLKYKQPMVWYPAAVKEFSVQLLKAIRANKKNAEYLSVEIAEATKEFLDAMTENNVAILDE